MTAARSLMLIGTLAVIATLWLTLLSGGGGGRTPAITPQGTTAPSGAAGGEPAANSYDSAIGAAQSAVQQSNEDARSAAGSADGTP